MTVAVRQRRKTDQTEAQRAVHEPSTIRTMTAKERLLQQAPQWNDAQAIAALRVIEAHDELASYLDEDASSASEDEDRWARANAREAIREERW